MLAKAYFKAALNNRSIVEVGAFQTSHTADYVKNETPPIIGPKARTIIKNQLCACT